MSEGNLKFSDTRFKRAGAAGRVPADLGHVVVEADNVGACEAKNNSTNNTHNHRFAFEVENKKLVCGQSATTLLSTSMIMNQPRVHPFWVILKQVKHMFIETPVGGKFRGQHKIGALRKAGSSKEEGVLFR